MKGWEELKLIKSIRSRAGKYGPGVVLGIGDDTAVIKTHINSTLLYTVDSIVEGVHFLGGLNKWESAGKRAIGAAISDIAAMGGVPLYTMLSLFLPENFPVKQIDRFMKGFLSRVHEYGISLVGGNITTMRGSFAADTVVIGSAYKGRFVKRSGAVQGDRICIAGVTGEAMAGLDLLRLKKYKTYPALAKKYLEPYPMLKESILILKNMYPTSMTDISDGLIQDLSHILDESHKGAEIDLDKMPVSDGVKYTGKLMNKSPYDYVLTGGDDYVLLFTVPESKYRDAIGSLQIYGIGRIVNKGGIHFLKDGRHVNLKLKKSGYVHKG